MVLGHSLWQGRFGSDPTIIGKAITLNGRPTTVVGVMPADFAFPSVNPIYVPLGPEAADWTDRGSRNGLKGLARLAPGVTVAQAQTVMTAIERRLEQAHPQVRNWHVKVEPLLDGLVRDFKRSLWVLLGAAGLVLLIACTNVAALLLARSVNRAREMAVRGALGATRPRILRQVLTESVLLAFAGAALGLLLSRLLLAVLLALAAQAKIPRASEVSLDGRVLLFSILAALVTGVAFGLAPAWASSRIDLQGHLKDSACSRGKKPGRLRQALVVAQVALTLVLLCGAGLLLKSFHHLQGVAAGYRHEGVITFRLSLPPKYQSQQQQIALLQGLEQRLQLIPGVTAVAAASQIPLDTYDQSRSFVIADRPAPPPHQRPIMDTHFIGEDYFRTLGIPLLRGRSFSTRDDRSHLRGTGREQDWAAGFNVIVIDEGFARQHWPNQDPIGQQVRLPSGENPALDPVMTVIGVVGHVRLDALRESVVWPQGYFAFTQATNSDMSFVLQSTLDAAAVTAAIRREVRALDPTLPIFGLQTLGEMRHRHLASDRLNLLLIGMFAALALVLAVLGLYGTLAYAIAQRQRELGVRVALGARGRDVIGLVIKEGMRLAVLGVATGAVAALLLTQLMRSLLFEVEPTDPVTFLAVVGSLLLVSLLACYIPGRRAAALDPLVALRQG